MTLENKKGLRTGTKHVNVKVIHLLISILLMLSTKLMKPKKLTSAIFSVFKYTKCGKV